MTDLDAAVSFPSDVLSSALFLLALLFLLTAPCARAQQVTPFEFGIGAYAQSNTISPGFSDASRNGYIGPFARATWNLNRSVALEGSAFDSGNGQPSGNKVGGHEVLVLGGVKAGVRRRRIGVFGRMDVGAASYSRALLFVEVQDGRILNAPPLAYRETHFTLDPGGTVEAYLSPRTILRADVDENLDAVFRTVHYLGNYGLYQILGGYVPHHLGFSLSVEHRFGQLRDAPALEPRPERWSIGAYFPLQIHQQTVSGNSPENAPALGGGGAWIEAPNYRFLSTDVLAYDLPHDDHIAGQQEGGTPLAFFAGPKVGFHLGRFGIFAKARPGFTRFSRTASSLTITDSGQILLVLHPQYQFSLDTGGVFEYTLAKHVQLRLETGDALIFYHSHDESYSYPTNSGTAFSPAMQGSSMLFLSGIGWRF